MAKISNLNTEAPKHGQALTELAIFGSILLICVGALIQYGMDANYQQRIQMEAFRKALKIAFHKDGPGASASLVLVKNKPIPDPRDQYGYAERSTLVDSGNVLWNPNANAELIASFSDTPRPQDLPAMYFEVNGDNVNLSTLSDPATLDPRVKADVPTAGVVNASQVFGIYTARFDKRPCPEVVKVVVPDPNRTTGREYLTINVSRDDIRVMSIEGGVGQTAETQINTNISDTTPILMYPYFQQNIGGVLHTRRILSADVDEDGRLEDVLAANASKVFFYRDSRSGNATQDEAVISTYTVAGGIGIDTEKLAINPWDRFKEKNNTWVPPVGGWVTVQNGTEITTVRYYTVESCTLGCKWAKGVCDATAICPTDDDCTECGNKQDCLACKRVLDTTNITEWRNYCYSCGDRWNFYDETTEVPHYETVWDPNATPGYYVTTEVEVTGEPRHKQGLIENFEKYIQHSGTSLVKTENNGIINSSTNMRAKQWIIHRVRFNNGQVYSVPAEFTVNQDDLYKW